MHSWGNEGGFRNEFNSQNASQEDCTPLLDGAHKFGSMLSSSTKGDYDQLEFITSLWKKRENPTDKKEYSPKCLQR